MDSFAFKPNAFRGGETGEETMEDRTVCSVDVRAGRGGRTGATGERGARGVGLDEDVGVGVAVDVASSWRWRSRLTDGNGLNLDMLCVDRGNR